METHPALFNHINENEFHLYENEYSKHSRNTQRMLLKERIHMNKPQPTKVLGAGINRNRSRNKPQPTKRLEAGINT